MRKLKLREINPLKRQVGLSCKGVVKIVKIKYFWCAAARAMLVMLGELVAVVEVLVVGTMSW